jgi:hypothetical protein
MQFSNECVTENIGPGAMLMPRAIASRCSAMASTASGSSSHTK